MTLIINELQIRNLPSDISSLNGLLDDKIAAYVDTTGDSISGAIRVTGDISVGELSYIKASGVEITSSRIAVSGFESSAIGKVLHIAPEAGESALVIDAPNADARLLINGSTYQFTFGTSGDSSYMSISGTNAAFRFSGASGQLVLSTSGTNIPSGFQSSLVKHFNTSGMIYDSGVFYSFATGDHDDGPDLYCRRAMEAKIYAKGPLTSTVIYATAGIGGNSATEQNTGYSSVYTSRQYLGQLNYVFPSGHSALPSGRITVDFYEAPNMPSAGFISMIMVNKSMEPFRYIADVDLIMMP